MTKTNYITPFIWLQIIGAGFTRGTFFMSFPYLAIILKNSLGASSAEIGFVLGAGPLVGTFTGFYGAYLSDRFGRRSVLICSLLGWGLTMLLFGMVNSVLEFGILSILNGFCRSVSEPVVQAIISERLEPESRVKAFHYRYYAVNVGAVVGPVIGSNLFVVSPSYGFFAASATLLLFCLVYALSPSSREETPVLMQVQPGFTDAVRTMLVDKVLLCYVSASIICAIAYVQIDTTLPLILGDLFGAQGVKYFSWVLIANGVTIVAAQLILNKLTQNVSLEWNVAVSCLVFGLGFLGFGYSGTVVSFYILSMVVLALGEALVFSNGYVLIDRLAPANLKATYHSTGNLFSLGFAIGPFLGTEVLERSSQEVLFTSCCALLFICAVLYLVPRYFLRKM